MPHTYQYPKVTPVAPAPPKPPAPVTAAPRPTR
jgi:hypothetical protein